jgi:hypothetical protein
VIERDEYSSLSAFTSVSNFSDAVSYEEVEIYVPVPRRVEMAQPGDWSPAVSEWSVDLWDFMFNPQWVIEEACPT